MNLSEAQTKPKEPMNPLRKPYRGRSELLMELKISFHDQDIRYLALADIGCQLPAVAGPKCFPKAAWVSATRRLQLVGAEKSLISGGEYGFTVAMHVPVNGRVGLTVFRCVSVFVHLAEVGERVLIGFPFFQQYRLAFLPNQQYLILLEDVKVLKAPRRYQGHCPACDVPQNLCTCIHQRRQCGLLRDSDSISEGDTSVHLGIPEISRFW